MSPKQLTLKHTTLKLVFCGFDFKGTSWRFMLAEKCISCCGKEIRNRRDGKFKLIGTEIRYLVKKTNMKKIVFSKLIAFYGNYFRIGFLRLFINRCGIQYLNLQE